MKIGEIWENEFFTWFLFSGPFKSGEDIFFRALIVRAFKRTDENYVGKTVSFYGTPSARRLP